jgi:hypothetical protein
VSNLDDDILQLLLQVEQLCISYFLNQLSLI